MVNDLSTLVQFPAQTVNKTRGTLNLFAVLLIVMYSLISLMSIKKTSRSSKREKSRGLGGAVVKRCWFMICQHRFKSLLRRGTLNVSADSTV